MAKKRLPKKQFTVEELQIPCPQCGKIVIQVDPWIKTYTDPHFNHKCGYKGVLRWRRNETKSE
jgi:predicted RNA-binding Zn-ribbon protein involved in translation (DUF1610 family)